MRQGKVKTEEEMNFFDHAYRSYQAFMIRVITVVRDDFLLPLVMLLFGFVLQKVVAHYFPKKADPKEVEKIKKMLRRRKEIQEQAEKEAKAAAERQLAKDTQVDGNDDDDEDVDH